jgi:hypothetical protein
MNNNRERTTNMSRGRRRFSFKFREITVASKFDRRDAYDPEIAIIRDDIRKGRYSSAYYRASGLEKHNILAAYLGYELAKDGALAANDSNYATRAAARARAMQKRLRGR